MLFWARILIHYTAQYVVCWIITVPVTRFKPLWFRVDFVYAAWLFYQEILIVTTGALANTAVFLLCYLTSYLGKRYLQYPKFFHKVVSWMGVYAVLDPFLTLLIDVCYRNWDGDMFRFYNHFVSANDSGAVGIYITVFLVLSYTIISGYVFYQYMVFRYMNGRILDLYRRLSGQYKAFFVPMDNEVSVKYLQWVITRAKK